MRGAKAEEKEERSGSNRQGKPRERIQTGKPSQRRPPEAGSRGKEMQNGAPVAPG